MRLWRLAGAILVMLAATGAAAQQPTPPTPRPQRHNVTQQEREAARAALDAFTSPTLTRFRDEAEFRRYIAAVREEQRTRGDYYYTYSSAAPQDPRRFAQASAPAQSSTQTDTTREQCIPTPGHPCRIPGAGDQEVMVTGTRIAPPRNPSITNNQMRNVEEG